MLHCSSYARAWALLLAVLELPLFGGWRRCSALNMKQSCYETVLRTPSWLDDWGRTSVSSSMVAYTATPHTSWQKSSNQYKMKPSA